MIKAEIKRTQIKVMISGEAGEIMRELHGFLNNVLTDIASVVDEPKQHLLTLLYQNILKEWSEENEDN